MFLVTPCNSQVFSRQNLVADELWRTKGHNFYGSPSSPKQLLTYMDSLQIGAIIYVTSQHVKPTPMLEFVLENFPGEFTAVWVDLKALKENPNLPWAEDAFTPMRWGNCLVLGEDTWVAEFIEKWERTAPIVGGYEYSDHK
jgi:hypothetical protein